MDARSRAFVVHRTPNRIRIKIPGRERHDSYFATLQRMLATHHDIIAVCINPLVASIVIYCRNEFDIASVDRCLIDCELVLPSRSPDGLPQVAFPYRDRSTGSIWLVNLAVKLTIAIATKRVEALIREWVIGAVVPALLRLLWWTLAQQARSESPRALLVAAAA